MGRGDGTAYYAALQPRWKFGFLFFPRFTTDNAIEMVSEFSRLTMIVGDIFVVLHNLITFASCPITMADVFMIYTHYVPSSFKVETTSCSPLAGSSTRGRKST